MKVLKKGSLVWKRATTNVKINAKNYVFLKRNTQPQWYSVMKMKNYTQTTLAIRDEDEELYPTTMALRDEDEELNPTPTSKWVWSEMTPYDDEELNPTNTPAVTTIATVPYRTLSSNGLDPETRTYYQQGFRANFIPSFSLVNTNDVRNTALHSPESKRIKLLQYNKRPNIIMWVLMIFFLKVSKFKRVVIIHGHLLYLTKN